MPIALSRAHLGCFNLLILSLSDLGPDCHVLLHKSTKSLLLLLHGVVLVVDRQWFAWRWLGCLLSNADYSCDLLVTASTELVLLIAFKKIVHSRDGLVEDLGKAVEEGDDLEQVRELNLDLQGLDQEDDAVDVDHVVVSARFIVQDDLRLEHLRGLLGEV